MCGRFRVEISAKDILGFYRLIEAVDKRYKEYENWFTEGRDHYPGTDAAVLTPQGIQIQTWGFPLNKKLVFNGRSESIQERRMFQPLIQTNRCVIPATAFYEWNSKRKFTIATQSPYLFMAGLYRTWQENSGPVSRFVILTTEADQEMQRIHPRMPVLLNETTLVDFLDPGRPFEAIRPELKPWDQGLRIGLSAGEQLSLMD